MSKEDNRLKKIVTEAIEGSPVVQGLKEETRKLGVLFEELKTDLQRVLEMVATVVERTERYEKNAEIRT